METRAFQGDAVALDAENPYLSLRGLCNVCTGSLQGDGRSDIPCQLQKDLCLLLCEMTWKTASSPVGHSSRVPAPQLSLPSVLLVL